MAVAFDADKMRISGEPFPIAEQVHLYPNTASAVYSVSDSGTLAYQLEVVRRFPSWYGSIK